MCSIIRKDLATNHTHAVIATQGGSYLYGSAQILSSFVNCVGPFLYISFKEGLHYYDVSGIVYYDAGRTNG